MTKKLKKLARGQATIEFLFSFIMLLGFQLTFITLSLNAVEGFMVHYATFMASRVYLVTDVNSNTADGNDSVGRQRAQEIFKKIWPITRGGHSSGGLAFHNPGSGTIFEYVGAYYDFEQSFLLYNIFNPIAKTKMRSESFIGREPSKIECLERICQAMKKAAEKGGISNCSSHITFYDNGC